MIRNLVNGKYYIGSAQNIDRRRKDHFRTLRGGYHHNRHIQSAWNQYGEEAFDFMVICLVPEERLIQVEQAYIDSFFAADQNFGYNLRPVAHSNLGYKFGEEMREKNRLAHLGKKHSDEAKRKTSEALTGKKKTKQHASRISSGKIGCKRPDVSAWAPEKLSLLSHDQVLAMREDHANGLTFRSLAEKYNCNASTAHSAVRGVGVFYSRIQA